MTWLSTPPGSTVPRSSGKQPPGAPGEGAGQNRDQLTAAGYIVLTNQHRRGDLDTDFKLFLQMGFRHHDHPFQKNPQNVAGFWFYYTSLRKKVQFPVGVYIQFIAFWLHAL